MPVLFQINVTANWGSTGRIAEEIGQLAIGQGWDSYIAYGRGKPKSRSKLIRIGSDIDMYCHAIQSRLLDNHGLASVWATRELVKKIEDIKPDIIHLHNIHGYYVNYKILFDYLLQASIPVVWTLHDCWTFTGHCAHFTYVGCDKWKKLCSACPQTKEYPSSLCRDRSRRNYEQKKKSFTSVAALTLVPVSDWLGGLLQESFLQRYPVKRIYNGVDTHVFCPQKETDLIKERLGINGKRMLLGVASVWGERKGLADFIALREQLPSDYAIVLVGLNDKQIKSLPDGVIGIARTNSVQELAAYYSAADVFINPTWEDNFPTTNLEALACGTFVITYRTGGSIEAIDKHTGLIVEQGDIASLAKAVIEVCKKDKNLHREICRDRVLANFNKDERFHEYIKLYDGLLQNKTK